MMDNKDCCKCKKNKVLNEGELDTKSYIKFNENSLEICTNNPLQLQYRCKDCCCCCECSCSHCCKKYKENAVVNVEVLPYGLCIHFANGKKVLFS